MSDEDEEASVAMMTTVVSLQDEGPDDVVYAAPVAGPSNVIVDDSPLQNHMERNKECKKVSGMQIMQSSLMIISSMRL